MLLVLDNAIKYNKKDTVYHKAAHRIKNHVQPVLEQFQATVRQKIALWMANEPQSDAQNTTDAAPILPNGEGPGTIDIITSGENPGEVENGVLGGNTLVEPATEEVPKPAVNGTATPMLEDEIVPATPTPEPNSANQIPLVQPNSAIEQPEPSVEKEPAVPSVGDLEPFPPVLRMLQDQASVSEDTPYIITADPLTSFFTYERPVLKPPPPPPPPPPRQSHKKKRKPTDPTTAGSSSRGASGPGRATRGNTQREPGSPHHHPPRVVLLVRDPAQPSEIDTQIEGSVEPTPGSTPTVRNAKRKRQDSEKEGWAQVVDDVNPHTSFTVSW